MKNIFLLPTDKPSRLWLYKYFDNLLTGLTVEKSKDIHPQHIYITNDEEIKEGDYGLDTFHKEIRKFRNKNFVSKYDKKIILTTDQDLIKDGVQAIDDDFLEWFVKNRSCERVEVVNDEYVDLEKDEYVDLYKIIIPQEEPKKEVTGVDDNRPKPNYCYAKEQGHGEIGCVFPACHCGLPIKQETLEEVEENIDREEWINFFKNNSKEEILEYLINYKFPL